MDDVTKNTHWTITPKYKYIYIGYYFAGDFCSQPTQVSLILSRLRLSQGNIVWFFLFSVHSFWLSFQKDRLVNFWKHYLHLYRERRRVIFNRPFNCDFGKSLSASPAPLLPIMHPWHSPRITIYCISVFCEFPFWWTWFLLSTIFFCLLSCLLHIIILLPFGSASINFVPFTCYRYYDHFPRTPPLLRAPVEEILH